MTPGTEELPTEMGALADRCEQATGPDWEIDRVIFAIACPASFADAEEVGTYADPNYRGNNADWRYLREIGLPRYTASIDAAMTLVPEGSDTQVNLYFGRDGEGAAVVSKLKQINLPRTFAATPALALCAAALRARAQANPATSDSKEEGR